MKKFVIIGLTLVFTVIVCARQHLRRQMLRLENETAANTVAELQSRLAAAETARQTAAQRAAELRSQLDLRHATVAEIPPAATASVHAAIAEPDPSRQGGWPAGAAYFYLPKQFLTNASYKLLAGRELTDEAAALLGLTPAERAAVNRQFAGMFSQFRDLESKAMQPIPPPESWAGVTMGMAKVDNTVAYQIPGLAENLGPVRQAFSQQIEQTLGPARGQLLGQAADAQLRQELDDLGGGQRTVGFVQATEKDGSYTLWYAVADARHGEGSFQRVPNDLDPNSQTAYYANLFGVKLPGK